MSFISNIFASLSEKRTQYIVALVILLLLFLLGFDHAHKGFSLSDEGLYASAPLRYTMGDIPFRDEQMTNPVPFDKLMSLVFFVDPHITLLQLRIFGLLIILVSLAIFFNLLRKFVTPVLAASICVILFLFNNFFGILTPGYNLLSSMLSLVALSLLLESYLVKSTKNQVLLSVVAGAFFTLAVSTYITLIALLVVPIGLLIYAFYKRRGYNFVLPCLLFILTNIILLLVILLAMVHFNILSDFISGSLQQARASDVGKSSTVFYSGVLNKIAAMFVQYRLRFLPSVLLFTCIAASLGVIWKTSNKTQTMIFGTLAVISSITFPIIILIRSEANIVASIFIILATVSILILHALIRKKTGKSDDWDLVFYTGAVWFLFLFGIYGLSSSNYIQTSTQGAIPLFAFCLVDLYRLLSQKVTHDSLIKAKQVLSRFVVAGFLTSLIIVGIYFYYNSVYEENGNQLDHQFASSPLKGIYSTATKVSTIENVLRYLESRVKPNDYLLAYDSIPIFYFLTHTRPSYSTVWTEDGWWPVAFRETLVKKMIAENKMPSYVIKMVDSPENNWDRPTGMYDCTETQRCPVDEFVTTNYYLEKSIFPFEIWRRGTGPKLKLYEKKQPLTTFSLNLISDGRELSAQEFQDLKTPFSIQSMKGNFLFKVLRDKDGYILHISSPKTYESDSLLLTFELTKADQLIDPQSSLDLTLAARVSQKTKKYPYLSSILFIQDQGDRTQINQIALYRTAWESYILSKKVQAGSQSEVAGILFQPQVDNEWIEIKDIKVYLEN